MRGLDPRIHQERLVRHSDGLPGSSPAMTKKKINASDCAPYLADV